MCILPLNIFIITYVIIIILVYGLCVNIFIITYVNSFFFESERTIKKKVGIRRKKSNKTDKIICY